MRRPCGSARGTAPRAIPSAEPDREAAERLLERVAGPRARAGSCCPRTTARCRTASAAGRPARGRPSSTPARARSRARRRRAPAASRAGAGSDTAPRPWPCAAAAGAAPCPAASSSRTVVISSKKRGSSRVSIVRGCVRSTSTMPAIRPGRADITTTRVERKTASGIECVTNTTVLPAFSQIRRSSMFRRSRVISSSAPNGSSISSSARIERRARARSRRAAACRPRAATDRARLEPGRARRARASRRRGRGGVARSQPSISSGSDDVARDGAPVVEHRVLEDDPVVVVEPRLVRGLAVHDDRAARRLDQVADDRAAASTCRSRTGRSARRTRPARMSRTMSCSAVTPVAERLRHAVELDDDSRAWTSREVLRRAAERRASRCPRPRGRRAIPSAAQTTFVAQRNVGLERVVLVEVDDRAAEPVLDRRAASRR